VVNGLKSAPFGPGSGAPVPKQARTPVVWSVDG
jgi:hypothetical protein